MDFVIMKIILLILFFAFGAVLGSFACCQAWRFRYKELGKRTAGGKTIGKRSLCLSCGHQLSAVENIPVFSWLVQRGRCKKCGKKIGVAEILSEISLGLVFLGVGWLVWPEITAVGGVGWKQILSLCLILILVIVLTIMWILAVYDGKWGKLPTVLLVVLNIVAVIYAGVRAISLAMNGNFEMGPFLLELISSIAILAGVYFLLYIVSDEKLVGGGDWLLALPIAIILGHWWLALMVLFLSNFIASIYGIIQKIKTKSSKIYFGPFLIIAFVAVFFLKDWLMKLLW
ncbi:prepilin peptidase [Candidatus Saccharibacteria bacterium]|nr:prepilin peptidase [Candidatus Saccharibacteria bacterium]